MIAYVTALLLMAGRPAPHSVSDDPIISRPASTAPGTGVRRFRQTCWTYLQDPDSLQREAQLLGFNYYRFGSRQIRADGRGAGTLHYSDEGPTVPRGSDRSCTIYMRIDPLDHRRFATALAAATGLPPGTAIPVHRAFPSEIRSSETRWTVRNADGTSLELRLVSYRVVGSGNVHLFLTHYLAPAAAAEPAR